MTAMTINNDYFLGLAAGVMLTLVINALVRYWERARVHLMRKTGFQY
ncbi:hypothetical protein [Burkholderia cenocepacia]|nr:hypothetical protein [Burkholderia cenocepacia]